MTRLLIDSSTYSRLMANSRVVCHPYILVHYCSGSGSGALPTHGRDVGGRTTHDTLYFSHGVKSVSRVPE